jgi:hypothetical protein
MPLGGGRLIVAVTWSAACQLGVHADRSRGGATIESWAGLG